jgi:hypothetical protein
MITVSKVWRRSFGPLRFTSPALVCLSIQHGIQRLFHRATNQLAKMVPDTGFIDLDP